MQKNVLERNLLGNAQYFLDDTVTSLMIISIQEPSTTAL